jgi:hypothetical protein
MSTMIPCEKFQIDIEKQLNQSLSPEELELLDVHLRSCARCQNFSQKTKEIDAMFYATTQEQLSQTQPGELEKKVLTALQEGRNLPFRIGISYLLFLPVLWFWLRSSLLVLTIYSAVMLGVFVLSVVASYVRTRSILRLIDLREPLVEFQVRQLKRSIAVQRSIRVVYLLGGVLNLVSALWREDGASFTSFQFVLGLFMLVLAVLAHRWMHKLKRELGALV